MPVMAKELHRKTKQKKPQKHKRKEKTKEKKNKTVSYSANKLKKYWKYHKNDYKAVEIWIGQIFKDMKVMCLLCKFQRPKKKPILIQECVLADNYFSLPMCIFWSL